MIHFLQVDGCDFEFHEFYIDDDLDTSENVGPEDGEVVNSNMSTRSQVCLLHRCLS